MKARWREIEALYRADYPRFARVAQAITWDAQTAAEAVQEGFADALRHAEQWEGRGTLEGWVWRCVVNRARKSRRPSEVALLDGGEAVSAPDTELRSRLAALPERQRLVVFLRYYADLSYREIAATLEIQVGTVSATLNAAHASLRAALDEVNA